MKFTHTIIYVQSVLETVQFYEEALGLEKKFIHESGEYAEMSTGDTILAFASEEMREFNGLETADNRMNQKPAGVEISFTTENVNKAYNDAIANNAISIKEPTEKPWGQIVAYVRDLNGFLIAFGSPMESEQG